MDELKENNPHIKNEGNALDSIDPSRDTNQK